MTYIYVVRLLKVKGHVVHERASCRDPLTHNFTGDGINLANSLHINT